MCVCVCHQEALRAQGEELIDANETSDDSSAATSSESEWDDGDDDDDDEEEEEGNHGSGPFVYN